ncbi:MAG: rRNA cytosine-C5-methyltransferase [Muribaculaceae bacterium]|nr:rRNA cytosine-C5-methyltransferase [Muribaculaceae bacterium]
MDRQLPPQFEDMTSAALADVTDTSLLFRALTQSDPVVSVRTNPRKPSTLPWSHTEPVTWCENGAYLAERPVFTLAPELHQGRIYVQDASSMFIHHALRQLCTADTPVTYLDACAAPGGKTGAAIDALPEQSLVVANEYDPRRASVLRENMVKWGYPDLIVTQGDTAAFRRVGAMFDIVAADVPCSGEGMMRKDPEAIAQWSTALVRECAERQRLIISNLWDSLRPGGYFIYSTCTFNTQENESMMEWMTDTFGSQPVSLDIPVGSGITVTHPRPGIDCYRFMPHMLRGEGLFMAVMRKPDDDTPAAPGKNRDKVKASAPVKGVASQCAGWIDSPAEYELTENNGLVTAFPRHYLRQLDTLRRHARVIQAGVAVATVKGKDLIPEHSLALSTLYRRGSFPEVELSLNQALDYLRRDAITLPDNTPRGFIAVTYGGYPLGFVKNLGNRCNNLYPQNWRIMMR